MGKMERFAWILPWHGDRAMGYQTLRLCQTMCAKVQENGQDPQFLCITSLGTSFLSPRRTQPSNELAYVFF